MYSGDSSKEPLVAIKSVFQKYDSDGSGAIGIPEFKSLCYDLGVYMTLDEAKLAVELLDKDGVDKISFNEFVEFWRSGDKFKKLDEAKTERLTQSVAYFRYFDKAHTGAITRQEFKALHDDLIKNGLLDASYTVESALVLIDENHDGKVSFAEFMDYIDKVQGF